MERREFVTLLGGAICRFGSRSKTWMPGNADKFTQSAQA